VLVELLAPGGGVSATPAGPRRVLVLGATSLIAQHVARELARGGARFLLVARDRARLEAVADDLRVRGATVDVEVSDLDDVSSHRALVARADDALGGFDVAIAAQGVLGDPSEYDVDGAAAARVVVANAVGPISLLTEVACRMAPRGHGCIVGLSSVAGDRGRGSNAAYGAGKAALSAFLSGLRARLSRSGVHVLTVKPGPVDTPMTAHLPKGPMFASPEAVARDVVRAIERRRDVLYTPARWRLVMAVIRAIPERVFKRLTLA
jgi:short-subunit dehydrogenase